MRKSLLAPTTVRRLVSGAAVFGGIALAVLTVAGRPLVGVGAYVVAMAAVVGAQLQANAPVFDERDERISKEAASRTLTVFGIASGVVFPALTVAWGLGAFEWQPWISAIALFVAVLFLTYGGFTAVVSRQR
jgi:uncharacterized membrane protein